MQPLPGFFSGFAATLVGGPLVFFVIMISAVIEEGFGNFADDGVFELFAALGLSVIYSALLVGLPVSAIGAALGFLIYDRPIAGLTLYLLLMIGNLPTLAALATVIDPEGSVVYLTLASLVVCTLSTLAAIFTFQLLRRGSRNSGRRVS